MKVDINKIKKAIKNEKVLDEYEYKVKLIKKRNNNMGYNSEFTEDL